MLEHVLVPLDGSVLAQSALDYALKLLGPNSKITLLTVLPPPEVPMYDFYPVTVTPRAEDFEAVYGETLTRARTYLKHLAGDIQEHYGFQVNTEIESGDAADLIVGLAGTLHVDAIVISTHGRSGLSRWLYGSVTQKVLTANCCPVFVIPPKSVPVPAQAPEQAHPAEARLA